VRLVEREIRPRYLLLAGDVLPAEGAAIDRLKQAGRYQSLPEFRRRCFAL